MNLVTNKILQNERIKEISDILNTQDKSNINIAGLTDSAKANIAYALTVRSKKSSLIVCSNILQANKMIQDLKFCSELEVIYFPAKTINYYELDAQSKEIENQRMYAIKKILSKEKIIVVTTVDVLLTSMYPSSTYTKIDIKIKIGDKVNLKELTENLVNLGYENVETVEGKGQFCVRGGIIDIFAINYDLPYRIELFGDEIDNIRVFDPLTQRSVEKVNKVEISFLNEVVLTETKKQEAIGKIENVIEKENINNELKENLKLDIEKIKEGKLEGIFDKYFDILLEKKSNILDYLKEFNVFIDEIKRCIEKSNNICYENVETLKVLADRNYLYIPFANKYLSFEDIEKKILEKNNIFLENINGIEKPFKRITFEFDIKEENFYKNSMEVLLNDIKAKINSGDSILLVFPSSTRVEQIKNYLIDNNVKVEVLEDIFLKTKFEKEKVYIVKSILSGGFSSESLGIFIVAESVSGVNITSKRRPKKKIGQNIDSFEDLEVGDYVVHENHGIGIYKGIETVNVSDTKKDYIKLEYANKGILYVPINQLDNVKKYVCDDDTVPKINSLNSKEWEKTKNKVNTHVRQIAKELVLLYAKREKSVGYAFSKDTPWQKEFEDSFEYELTDDQKQAIKEIKEDMESNKSMDRLLCGDVGYGKTEVAIRAAFKAVMDSKQVAYLVPTTVLSMQQYNTFKSRMEKFGINVEMLNRFRSPKRQKQIIKELIDGKIDVLIGTHRMLSKDVFFKDLGLLIIDEEHRFGVKAKEAIKVLKENIDVLSMTATPIPRTLHMSMIGIRKMSTLNEPPLERLPIHTYVLEYDDNIIKEAIEKELLRDGQVIYLNNRVEKIEQISQKVKSLVPGAKVITAHGRMEANQIEDAMIKFVNHEADIIICTTILETGIDIPNANTLVIEDADKLGLAQLYQIRGRVGRSNRLAYAYVTYPKNKQISEVSEKRLKAIKDFTEFGSGFKIALRDLEIRGAGSILGHMQHGHMARVGYEMYLSLLERAIKEEKKNSEGKEDNINDIDNVQKDVKIELNVSAYISDSYIKDPLQKIAMYQKISDIQTKEESLDVIDELLDRYGELPKETENLLKIVEIRNKARALGITKIVTKDGFVMFEPLNLRFALTNGKTSDILIRVQLEMSKLEEMLKEKG